MENNELELVVKTKTLGELTTNAMAIKDKVTKMLVNYDAKNYSENNIEEAKNDKAMLNSASKKLNDDRIKLEKEFMAPFNGLKDIISDTCQIIKDASTKIDVIVKDVENRAKEDKRNQIQTIFDFNAQDLEKIVTLEMIFDDRYLNKSYELKDVEADIITKLENIRKDLIAIGMLKSKFETELKSEYLQCFNLGQIINKNNDLLEKEKILVEQNNITQEVVQQNEIKKMNVQAEKVVINLEEEIMTFKLKITGTVSQLQALRKFIDTNNMKYEKM